MMNVNGGADRTEFGFALGTNFVSPPSPGIIIRIHGTSGTAAYTLTFSNPADY